MTHSWFPHAPCDPRCVSMGDAALSPLLVVLARLTVLALLVPVMVLAMPLPGRARIQRLYCRMVLHCFGVEVGVTGDPMRNLRGVLVVSNHISWLDIFALGSLVSGSFVARADMFPWPAGIIARVLRIVPIQRHSLRLLPGVVNTVARRLAAGQTVVCFPEGTTWCGLASGPFYPAMFQAAVDAGTPVQPLRLTYHHTDGSVSTVPSYVEGITLSCSIRRLLMVRRTLAWVHIESLQLPGTDRRELARRCQSVVGVGIPHSLITS
jgi:1-acyl-sn-glycerol-3-phosphate acyltransferase